MASRGLNFYVNIGAKLLPSLNTTASGIERRFGLMNKRLRVQAAETKLAYREIAGAMKPIAAMAAAGGLTLGLKGIFGESSEYAHEVAMLRASGRTMAEVSRSIAQAHKALAEVPTSSLATNLKIINETTGAFGSLDHALETLSFNSRFGYMMTNMLGMDPGEVPHALNSGVRALEIRGTAMNAAAYQRDMGELFRAMVFFKGRFNTEELAAFSQTGNIPIKGYSERFLTRVLPSLITELGGGDVTGTQAAAFRNQILGRVPLGGKKLTEEWVRMGIVPASAIGGGTLTRNGWAPGSVKGHDLAMKDPFAWMETVMLPALQAHGVNTADPNAVILQMSKMFGRETAARFATMLADPRQRARLHKDEKMIGQALPLNKSFELMLQTDPIAAQAEAMASIKHLETALGQAITPDVVQALHNFAKGVNYLAEVFEAHPVLAKMAVGFMAFGAAAATLKVFDIVLGWVLKPFRVFGQLLLWIARTRAGGLIANMLIGLGRALKGLGGFVRFAIPALLAGIRALGAPLFRAMVALGPWLLRGIAAAFGLLSNPVGWAILAASAAALVWTFRNEIAKAWANLINWFTNTAWPAIRDTWNSIDWGAVGRGIATAIWTGFKNYTPAGIIGTGIYNAINSVPHVDAQQIARVRFGYVPDAPKPEGKRATGGPVTRGRTYLVGERGEEVFTPDRSGTIIPHSELERRRQERAGVTVGSIVINGANDPDSTRRIVRQELDRLASGQAGYYND